MGQLQIALEYMFALGASNDEIMEFVGRYEAARHSGDRATSTERVRKHRENKRGNHETDETCNVTVSESSIYNNINKQSKGGAGGTTPENGCNPRANGTNPRSLGTNPRSLRKSTGEPLFDEFWEVFPRKIARAPALKAWKAAVRDGVDPQTMIAGAKAYAARMRGTEPVFIKYPQGWISGKRWEDEPEKPKVVTMMGGEWKPFKPEPEGPKISEEERQANLAKLATIKFGAKKL